MQGPQRKVAAILIADPVGPARYRDDAARMHAARAQCHAIIEDLVRGHDGRMLDGDSDRIVALFHTPAGAVGAAMAMQAALAERNVSLSDQDRTLYRIGLDTVDIETDGGRRVGEGLAVAMALSGEATPGGLYVTGSVFDQVRDRIALRYTDAGEQRLEGLDRPVRVYRVGAQEREGEAGVRPRKRKRRGSRWLRIPLLPWLLAVGLAYLALQAYQNVRHEPDPLSARLPAVAVLSFAAPDGDPADAILSEAMARDIVEALGRFPTLAVLAREAVAPFESGLIDTQALRAGLDARYVVSGVLRREDGRLRGEVTLTDAADGRAVLTRTYDEDAAGLFRIEDDLVRRIAGALGLAIRGDQLERTRAKPPATLEAYELVAHAEALVAQGGQDATAEARALVQQALAIDPAYATAHAALAAAYAAEGTPDALTQAEAAARAALDLDPENAAAHRILAQVYQARGDAERASLQAEQAIRLNASEARGHAILGTIALWNGKSGDAVRALEPALRLNPALVPELAPLLGFAYALSDRDAKCEDLLEPYTADSPDMMLHAALAVCFAEVGRIGDARQEAARVLRLWPAFEIEPFVNAWSQAAARERIAGSLRKAGLE